MLLSPSWVFCTSKRVFWMFQCPETWNIHSSEKAVPRKKPELDDKLYIHQWESLACWANYCGFNWWTCYCNREHGIQLFLGGLYVIGGDPWLFKSSFKGSCYVLREWVMDLVHCSSGNWRAFWPFRVLESSCIIYISPPTQIVVH